MAAATGDICIVTHMLDAMPCGVGRYLEALLEEFKTFDLAARIHLVHPQPSDHPHYGHFRHSVVPMPSGKWRETRWAQWRLPRRLRPMQPALVHWPIQTNPPVFALAAPLVLTVWDFSPVFWRDRGWSPLRRWLVFGVILRRAVARAAAILVPSQSTRRDLGRLYGNATQHGNDERIRQVPCAVDRRFEPRPEAPRPVPSPYLLYVGSLDARKNVATLVRALAHVRLGDRVPRLLLVTSPTAYEESGLPALAREQGVADRIEVRGKVEEEDLSILYTHCEAFVFPSAYEGWGLPVLEAMACGAPVITTRCSALSEVAGEAVRYFQSDDPQDLAHVIEAVAGDPDTRRSLSRAGVARAAQFSWRRTAEQTAAVYEQVLAGAMATGRSAP